MGGKFGGERIHVYVWWVPPLFIWNCHELLIDCTPKQNKKLKKKKKNVCYGGIHMLIMLLYICCLLSHEVFGLKALFTFFNVCELKQEALETLKIFFDQFPEKSMYVTM